jgi:hypothetical protein
MKTFKEIRFSNSKNMTIMNAHTKNHLNLKYHFMKQNSRNKMELKRNKNGIVSTKVVLQPRDVLHVINTLYISFYFDLYLLLWFRQRFKFNHRTMITLK